MIDTHAHLNFPELEKDIEDIVEKSKKAGLTGIIIASSNLKDSEKAIGLAKKYPGFLYASVGIHPQKTDTENKATIEEQLKKLESLLSTDYRLQQIVTIGECGLDFSPAPPGEEDRSEEEQEELFLGQIKLAEKFNLPLIVHARESVDEVLSTLSNLGDLRGTFHCYAGGKKRVSKILGLPNGPALSLPNGPALSLPNGWYFGFDGNLTYDEGLQYIIKLIPEDRILIETDSPFLAPIPFRNQTCYPYYLPNIQKCINEIFGKDMTNLIRNNSQVLFGL